MNLWMPIILFGLAIVVMTVSSLTSRTMSKRQKSLNIGLSIMCAGGLILALPRAAGITDEDLVNAMLGFGLLCNVSGLIFIIRRRDA